MSAASSPLPFLPGTGRRWVLHDSTSLRSVGARLVGGKALRLLQLRSLGALVPPFVVVTTAPFRKAIGTDPVILDRLAHLREAMLPPAADPQRLKALSEETAARVRSLGCPGALTRTLLEATVIAFRKTTQRTSAFWDV